MTATSDYLNQRCRSLDEVLRTRALSALMPAIGDVVAVQPTSSPATVAGSVPS
jgi:hypothetical protein